MAQRDSLGPISAVRVFTFDLPRSLAFYGERLGLAGGRIDDSVAFFETGACRLILEAADPTDAEEQALVGRFAGLSFTVENIQTAYQTLQEEGVLFLGPPERQDWGGQLAHFQDPDGNVLSLVQYG